MVTNEERCEVARRLRGTGEELGSSVLLWYRIAKALGVRTATDGKTACGMLADLIEPSGDRDALLALADEMERMPQCELCPAEIVDCSAHPDGCPDVLLDHYARRIREALGVKDHASHDD